MFHLYSRVEYDECNIPYRAALRRKEYTRSTARRKIRLCSHFDRGNFETKKRQQHLQRELAAHSHSISYSKERDTEVSAKNDPDRWISSLYAESFEMEFGRGSSIMRILSNL